MLQLAITLGACTRLKLNVSVIRMGRPAGTVETKLSNEEVNQIVASVDCAKVNDVIVTRGLLDMANIFDKAADKAPGRAQLEKMSTLSALCWKHPQCTQST